MSSTPGAKPQYGGRALGNGVMMAGPKTMAIAIRRDDGSIGTAVTGYSMPFAWSRTVPFLRGIFALAGALTLAGKSRRLENEASGGKSAESGKKLLNSGIRLVVTTVIERALLHVLVGRRRPGRSQKTLRSLSVLSPLIAFRLATMTPAGKTLRKYHAAEHMAVNTAEAGLTVDAVNAGQQSRIHPRCGTTFAFWALLLGAMASRKKRGLFKQIVMGLTIVSTAYELARLGASLRNHPWAKFVFEPSWQAQRLTTMIPEQEHLEVACAALNAVILATSGRTSE